MSAGARLREVARVRQRQGEGRRRWFTAAGADLFVWQAEGVITRFEFCYDKPLDEHVLAWEGPLGLRHARIDDGEGRPLRKLTPIVVADGEFDPARVALEFERVGALVEPAIFRFVLGRLFEPETLDAP